MNSVCKRGLGRSGDRSGERFGPDCGVQRNPHRPNPLLPTILLRPLLLSRTQPLRGGPASPTRFGEELVIVTRDSDFNDFGLLKGFPPFAIWIKSGNSSVCEQESILRKHSIRIREFTQNQSLGLIEIE